MYQRKTNAPKEDECTQRKTDACTKGRRMYPKDVPKEDELPKEDVSTQGRRLYQRKANAPKKDECTKERRMYPEMVGTVRSARRRRRVPDPV